MGLNCDYQEIESGNQDHAEESLEGNEGWSASKQVGWWVGLVVVEGLIFLAFLKTRLQGCGARLGNSNYMTAGHTCGVIPRLNALRL